MKEDSFLGGACGGHEDDKMLCVASVVPVVLVSAPLARVMIIAAAVAVLLLAAPSQMSCGQHASRNQQATSPQQKRGESAYPWDVSRSTGALPPVFRHGHHPGIDSPAGGPASLEP